MDLSWASVWLGSVDEEEKRLEVASTLRNDNTVLHVAVARLLGYRWPAELEGRSGILPLSSSENTHLDSTPNFELADEQREWVKRCDTLLPYADEDGIVCLPPVRKVKHLQQTGSSICSQRWKSGRGFQPLSDSQSDNCLQTFEEKQQDAASTFQAWLNQLLANADHAGKTLETWLRKKFSHSIAKLFQHRPFIWHIWDGLRDGFAALVNYHKLDYKNLETLIYTYLGDWITRQKQDIANSVDGAQERSPQQKRSKRILNSF